MKLILLLMAMSAILITYFNIENSIEDKKERKRPSS